MHAVELLKAYQAHDGHGSEEAFAEVVRRYTGFIYSIAKRRLSNEQLAQDVTQTVFLRLAGFTQSITSEQALTAWLHRTTLNVSIDAWRVETRRREREQKAHMITPAENDPELWAELAPHLDEALDKIEAQHRTVLLLRFLQAKSMKEV